MAERHFRVRNWAKHQPRGLKDGYQWVRLYRSLVSDFDFCALPEIAQLQLVKLWLVCDPKDGTLDGDAKALAWAIRSKSKIDTDLLVSTRFLEAIPGDSREMPFRGEERREEEMIEEAERVVVFSIDVKGDEKGPEPIHEDEIDRWSKLFPALDIRSEIQHAIAWYEADPTRKKTRGGIRKSLVGWFGRSQNAGNGRKETRVPRGTQRLVGVDEQPKVENVEEFLRKGREEAARIIREVRGVG